MEAEKKAPDSNFVLISGFTIVEMMVVVSIIAILAAALLPSLVRAREMGNQIACSNNLKQIATAMFSYANDFNEMLVPASTSTGYISWQLLLTRQSVYLTKDSLFCPSQEQPPVTDPYYYYRVSLGVNFRLYPGDGKTRRLSSANSPSLKIFVLDSYQNNGSGFCDVTSGWWRVYLFKLLSNSGWGLPAGRHLNNCNTLFLDGHIETSMLADIQVPLEYNPFKYSTSKNNIDW